MDKLTIKTGNEIYFDGCDVRKASKKHNYDDYYRKKQTDNN